MKTHTINKIFSYLRQNFTHYILSKDRKIIGTKQIVILNEDHLNKHYELHFFDISNELSWNSKIRLDFGNNELRFEDNIFRSDIKTFYFFIDSSSYKIFCYYISADQNRVKSRLQNSDQSEDNSMK